jgi:type IV pilus modification protein PilV
MNNKGFSMLEVMISLLIVSITISGFLWLEHKKLSQTLTVRQKLIAMLALADLAERMHANPAGIGAYVSNSTGSGSCMHVTCAPTALAQFDRQHIINAIKTTLPDASIAVTAGTNDYYTLTLSWQGVNQALSSTLTTRPTP